MNIVPKERQIRVLMGLVEGNSLRSLERQTGTHRDTIMRLLVHTGEGCAKLLDKKMVDLPCRYVQVDEIWTFVRKKQRMLTKTEKRNPELGDQFCFVSLDSDSKLIISHCVGKRDGRTATQFMADLQRRLTNRIQLTTDGFDPYVWAVENAFGSDVDYGQLVKIYKANGAGRGRYAPPECVEAISTVINGEPNPYKISTSYVERQNLTMRMSLARLARLSLAFSKKLDNLKAALALHFAWYNFGRVHGSLRVTPAMEADIADHIWTMEELLGGL
ncbi:MAG: IS1 family transposase [Nitrospinae bacterium]|nr:IS1 family transposase [Nitrospinota bacterium]